MAGLSKELFADLRATLLNCGPFYSGRALQTLFVDERLRPWRNNLPDASSNAGRVDIVISYLINRRNRRGENALWLLTEVLQDQADPEDACHEQLADISGRLQRELNQPDPDNAPERSAPSRYEPVDLVRLYELIAKHFDLEELRTLCFRLGLDIADLPGEGRNAKARELVTYMNRRLHMADLIAQLQQERPDVNW